MFLRPGSCATCAKEVADELGVAFVDMHNLTADYLDRKAAARKRQPSITSATTHTSLLGAELNAKMFPQGYQEDRLRPEDVNEIRHTHGI